MTDPKPTWVDPKVAAAIWEIDLNNLYTLLNEGKIQGAVQIGRRWKIPYELVYPQSGQRERQT